MEGSHVELKRQFPTVRAPTVPWGSSGGRRPVAHAARRVGGRSRAASLRRLLPERGSMIRISP